MYVGWLLYCMFKFIIWAWYLFTLHKNYHPGSMDNHELENAWGLSLADVLWCFLILYHWDKFCSYLIIYKWLKFICKPTPVYNINISTDRQISRDKQIAVGWYKKGTKVSMTAFPTSFSYCHFQGKQLNVFKVNMMSNNFWNMIKCNFIFDVTTIISVKLGIKKQHIILSLSAKLLV